MNDIIFLWFTTFVIILSSVHNYALGVQCNRWQKKCQDYCVDIYKKCPSCAEPYMKNCPDGSCIRREESCPDGCAYDEKKCDQGACVLLDRFCPEEDCPEEKPLRCSDGDCYSNEERCNKEPYCLDESDENDCSLTFQKILDTPWLIVIISVIIFALFCLIIAMCCRYKNNEDRRRKARRATRLRHQHEDNYDMMPAVSGRRMQPVSSRQQRTPSQVGQDPRSPGVNSPPSPFNPEMMPFIACSPYGQSGHSPYQAQSSGSSPHPAHPSAPPLGLEPHLAPPPYCETVGEDYIHAQPGVPGRDYLPSYETVQRSGPPGQTPSSNPIASPRN